MERFMRLPEVIQTSGLKKSAIWKWIKEGRFPKNIRLGAKTVVWKESDIQKWIASFDDPNETGGAV